MKDTRRLGFLGFLGFREGDGDFLWFFAFLTFFCYFLRRPPGE